MSVEADGVDSEEESATPDWRVRAGPRNRPSQKKREEHEVTHVQVRDRCTHFMMDGGRTHRHATKQRSEDETRRPTFAMDYFFMRMQAAVNSRTISEEATTCIAVNEDRHPNIMSSVALKKEVEEPWTGERVAKSIDRPQLRSEIVSLKSAKQKWPQKIAWEIPTRESVQFVEKVLAKPVSADPMNRMNPRYEFGIWLGMRSNCAECFIGNGDRAF